MIKEYTVQGMTCNGCVGFVQQNLEELSMIESAEVTLTPPVARLKMDMPVPIGILQDAIGKYIIEEKVVDSSEPPNLEIETEISLVTYKPLFLIVAFIAGVSLLCQYPFDSFSGMLWMRHFMAGFFIVFSFFKLLNLQGFSESYSMYDVVAKRWNSWGYIYPFVELVLGILYLTNIAPFQTNLATIVILGISTIGVIESNINKRKIKCACLGDVFNLPMSTVTIVEDVSMVLMAAGMLFFS